MAFGGISYLSILLAAVAAFLFGAAYYTTLSKPWLAACGIDRDKMVAEGRRNNPLPFILSFVGLIIMGFVLAGAIGHLGPGQVTLKNGVISGFILWGGFILTTTTVMNAFQQKPFRLSLIDSGHWLGVMLIMGAIIGGLGA